MGSRVTQVNYECAICGHKAKDGEHMWYMGSDIWCESCCDDESEQSIIDNGSWFDDDSYVDDPELGCQG